MAKTQSPVLAAPIPANPPKRICATPKRGSPPTKRHLRWFARCLSDGYRPTAIATKPNATPVRRLRSETMTASGIKNVMSCVISSFQPAIGRRRQRSNARPSSRRSLRCATVLIAMPTNNDSIGNALGSGARPNSRYKVPITAMSSATQKSRVPCNSCHISCAIPPTFKGVLEMLRPAGVLSSNGRRPTAYTVPWTISASRTKNKAAAKPIQNR
jgi:hypothetical protein